MLLDIVRGEDTLHARLGVVRPQTGKATRIKTILWYIFNKKAQLLKCARTKYSNLIDQYECPIDV